MAKDAPDTCEADRREAACGAAAVAVDGAGVVVHLGVDDPVLADLLRRHPEEDRVRVMERVLAVGARGLVQMGVGLDLGEIDERVRRSVAAATAEAEDRVGRLLAEASTAMTAALDPAHRTSVVARAMEEFCEWRDQFLRVVDPEVATSHTGRLVSDLRSLLGPGGPLEQRLTAALDPGADGSGIARLAESIERRFGELREMLAEQRGRSAEADRGTAKGFDFEDAVEEHLRAAARAMGAIVERTSRQAGSLGGEALVGDYVVVLPTGARVVVEAKNNRSIGLTGAGGILAELDRAIANRTADAAICVSAGDAFPAEVGPFGVYGNRLLVVDDGEGTMVWVALRWAAAVTLATASGDGEVDSKAVADRLARIEQLSKLFTSNRRALTDISGSVEKVRSSLEGMRLELLELVDEIGAEVLRARDGRVVEIHREAG